MQLEIGEILEGKITGLTKFGAFVQLAENKTGLIHISEIAPVFVKEITDFVQEGQIVKVKVLNLDNGKISLSMKQAMPSQPSSVVKASHSQLGRGKPEYVQSQNKKNDAIGFEEMLHKFKQSSDEKIAALKKGMDSKRGGSSRNGFGQSR